MLYEFFQWLSHYFHSFNVFNYITLRAILAVLTSLAISLLCGPSLIRYLMRAKIGQMVRSDGPQSHLSKQGIPTMGGVLLLSASLGTTLLWADLTNHYVWILIAVTAGFGAIGWVDDYRKIYRRNSKGLSFRQKIFWQTLLALVAAVVLAVAVSLGNNDFHWRDFGNWLTTSLWSLPKSASLIVPFMKGVVIPMGLVSFVVLTILVIVGSSNAVNLTDGLDGLAIMPVVMVAGALGIFAYASGNVIYANYLLIPSIPGAGEAVIFCAALVGAGLGFLWFNAYPAEVFMGDMGALALGAALAALAVIVRQEIVYFIMGGVFVIEALSVMAQVGYFRYSAGQRIFRMAPLHHHFELSGWKENQVVVRFWILSIILVLVGLSSLKIR